MACVCPPPLSHTPSLPPSLPPFLGYATAEKHTVCANDFNCRLATFSVAEHTKLTAVDVPRVGGPAVVNGATTLDDMLALLERVVAERSAAGEVEVVGEGGVLGAGCCACACA